MSLPNFPSYYVLRLLPGEDLRGALQSVYAELALEHGIQAASVVSAVGSLETAHLRYAAQPAATELLGPLELITLSGTLSADGVHLHASVADAVGQVRGGHVMPGCVVRTTAEIVLALLPEWRFSRHKDETTGYLELVAVPTAPR